MNKALHVFVYLFLVLAGAGLWFEMQLNAKRTLLTDRNRLQENYIVKLARTIEKAEPEKGASLELKKDSSPVEARLVDIPDTENVLEEYKNELEQANLETLNFDNKRDQLRAIYVLDDEGKPVMDGSQPLMTGKGTEDELLSQLLEASKAQQTRLNNARGELVALRTKLEETVEELNKLKPEARQDKVTIVERDEKIGLLEGEKSALTDQITKQKAQIDELNAEATSLRDEVACAKDETEAVKEDLDKANKQVEELKKHLRDAIQTAGAKSSQGASVVSSLPAGDKGQVVEANNEYMYAIVKFSESALLELKGNNPDAIVPPLEMSVKRAGFAGAAGEFVGRLRLRQEVKGKPYVICDILGSWEQSPMQKGDTVFAD